MITVWRHDISLNLDVIEGSLIRFYALHNVSVLEMTIDGIKRTLTIRDSDLPFFWNGADGAVDLLSDGPMWHDLSVGNSLPEPYKHEGRWTWDDGSPITDKQQAQILKYCYRRERRRHTGWRRGLAVKLWWKVKRILLRWKGARDGG